jgi:hypothetical protein
MELLQRFPLPRRLSARLWLLTLPSGLLSFERRQRIPRMPIGRGRFLGLGLVAAGGALLLRSRRAGGRDESGAGGLSRFRDRPAVAGALLALGGVGLLLRSLMVTAYVVGLAFAFARDAVELEAPELPGGSSGDNDWEYDETQV